MIALVLAAGYGTRLLPYSAHTPKPLFTLNRQPLLDIIVQRLLTAGARTVIVNTHHHRQQIEEFLRAQPYAGRIVMRHEPTILGTGGAIRNTADIWRSHPLLVVNSDIFTDMDFAAFYRFHLRRSQPVSLALCDDPDFNSVAVDAAARVVGFQNPSHTAGTAGIRRMTFTGIQMLDETILAYLPPEGFAGSIEAYQAMIHDGCGIAAYIPEKLQWSDLGTPERYRSAARTRMAEAALQQAGIDGRTADIEWQPLPGDGSDRQWYRLAAGRTTMIVVDHGIKPSSTTCEAEAFVAIGRHLHRQGLPVPAIHLEDPFAGLVFMEDLGTMNLQTFVQSAPDRKTIADAYVQLVDILLDMALRGGEGFDPAWTFQTPRYDRDVVLNLECRYFIEAFLEGYLGIRPDVEGLMTECGRLADAIAAVRPVGFMHRDFQSRNIMVRKSGFYLIDFQGGRVGPPHYDLAALLIDPYVDLPAELRETLLGYFASQLAARSGRAADKIQRDYRFCALARNLQILGAYGHLTRRKGKLYFARFIPAAVLSLQANLGRFEKEAFPLLSRLANDIIPPYLPTA
jgi:aminoglycoside/choline kinase family phosphotransferase